MKTATAKEKEVSKIYQSRDEKKLTKIKENMHREGKERKGNRENVNETEVFTMKRNVKRRTD